ncbi:unnamed protein product [Dicrocoelium dendriticum]|nr:unnamed protein product [Dicrocoelium dendriticum]
MALCGIVGFRTCTKRRCMVVQSHFRVHVCLDCGAPSQCRPSFTLKATLVNVIDGNAAEADGNWLFPARKHCTPRRVTVSFDLIMWRQQDSNPRLLD